MCSGVLNEPLLKSIEMFGEVISKERREEKTGSVSPALLITLLSAKCHAVERLSRLRILRTMQEKVI